MKVNRVIQMLFFVTLGSWAYAYDFKVTNEDGFELCYEIRGTTACLVAENSDTSLNYNCLTCDTIRLQEQVEYAGRIYDVGELGSMAFGGTNCRYIYFPRLLHLSKMTGSLVFSKIEGIIVSDENPYYASKDGVLYSKTGKTLLLYPPAKKEKSYLLPEGIDTIGDAAFWGNKELRFLETPLTVKHIGFSAFYTDSLEKIICKDSVETIEYAAFFYNPQLQQLVLGNSLKESKFGYLTHFRPIVVQNRTLKPSSCIFTEESPDKENLSLSTLYVPRQSVHLYQQADGWKAFGTILPIEPPIVTGVDTASVSWVQNFSATGYVWTLYTDEAKTQQFMSLTFDGNGHLTHIDINPGHMPARMPALYSENGEEEKRFAEYYSFTISGLSPETRYYYTRQSMKGMEVIDEETGSFETLSNETTGLNPCTGFSSYPQKIIKDGSVYILHQKKKYSLDGNCINR